MRREEKKGLTFFSVWTPWLRARILGIHRAGASDLERNQDRAHEQQGLVGLAAALRDQRESSEKLDKKISFSPSSSLILSPGSSEPPFLYGLYIPSPLSRRQRSIRAGEHKHKSKETKKKTIKKQQERGRRGGLQLRASKAGLRDRLYQS
jgi:hypothetical protein